MNYKQRLILCLLVLLLLRRLYFLNTKI